MNAQPKPTADFIMKHANSDTAILAIKRADPESRAALMKALHEGNYCDAGLWLWNMIEAHCFLEAL